MKYPIFNSVINRIESELNQRNIKIKTFKTWDDNRINATGLEINIDLTDVSDYIKEMTINFDWDRFRETVLAQQLDGMEAHPFLQEKHLTSTKVSPIIDIELIWIFDQERSQSMVPETSGDRRMEAASKWMENVSKEVNELLLSDDIITRWHIEVEGDDYGKYLSAINLLSYFQYSLDNLESLNEVHQFVSHKLQHLLYKANKVIQKSDKILHQEAAA